MRFFLAVLLSFSVWAAEAGDVRFKGTKPAVIIDVRSTQEFAAGHIEGAVNIPFDQIGQGIQTIKGLTPESAILLYCRSGRRSAIARGELEKMGFKHILDGGGMEALAHHLKTCSAQTC